MIVIPVHNDAISMTERLPCFAEARLVFLSICPYLECRGHDRLTCCLRVQLSGYYTVPMRDRSFLAKYIATASLSMEGNKHQP
jgi:hypothetical protein